MTSAETIQQVYIRVCRDSGFKLDWIRATNLTASIVGKHPMDVWIAIGTIDVMEAIAQGEHPATLKK